MLRFLVRRSMLHAPRPVRAPTIVVGFLSLLAATIPAAAEKVSSAVIRIYDGGATDAETRADALHTAAAIIADSGVDAGWHDCTPVVTAPRCNPVREPRDLMIRILPASAPGSLQPADGIRGDQVAHGMTLGFAVMHGESGTGVLGTIFMDRVRMTAERTGVPLAVLLGRAIAHEAGHLLLGTGGHARSGLMREVWTDKELTQDRPGDWLFTARERRLLGMASAVRAASSGRNRAGQIAPPSPEVRDIESTR